MNLLEAGRNRSYNCELAKRLGLNEALFLCQLDFHLAGKNNGKEHGGRKYFRMKVGDWHDEFPFWSERTVRSIIKKCEEKGWIESSKLDGSWSSQTKWYTLNSNHSDFGLDTNVADCHVANTADSQQATIAGSQQATTADCHKATTAGSCIDQEALSISSQDTVNKITEVLPEEIKLYPGEFKNGIRISVWYRKLLKRHKHVKGTLPEHTIVQKGQLKKLIAKLGPDAPELVENALRHWPAFTAKAKEMGRAVSHPSNVQKMQLLTDVLVEFEPPEEYIPDESGVKKLGEVELTEFDDTPDNPDLEL